MAWIKVRKISRRLFNTPISHYQIQCQACGHDAFKKTFNGALVRARDMASDHIPYSPDGSLNCKHWGTV